MKTWKDAYTKSNHSAPQGESLIPNDKYEELKALTKPFMLRGREANRKVVEMSRNGNGYYHKDNVVEWDEELEAMLCRYGMCGNSILINFYTSQQKINWHTDSIEPLVEGSKIYSLSLTEYGSTRKIGSMGFERDGGDGLPSFYLRDSIGHGDVFCWDAYEHARKKIKHYASTRIHTERLNITMRTLKD